MAQEECVEPESSRVSRKGYVSAEVQSSRERRSCDERYNTRIDHCMCAVEFSQRFSSRDLATVHKGPFTMFPLRFALSIKNVYISRASVSLSHRMPALISPWAVADAPLLTSK